MNTYLDKVAQPSDDKRWKLVGATMRRNGYRRDALIEALHTVQQSFGYLDEPSLRYVASSLRVPLSQAYGVVHQRSSGALGGRREGNGCEGGRNYPGWQGFYLDGPVPWFV
jgi:Thioredoxin-like [2Fe-2S] ferredoxin